MIADFCQNCGFGQERGSHEEEPELLWTDDDQALCVLCSVEIVLCECGESLQRLYLQFTAGGDVCPSCAAAPPVPERCVEQLAA